MKKLYALIVLLHIIGYGYAQPGAWTCLKLNTGNPPYFGIQGISDSVSYPPPYGHAGWTDSQGIFWLYGGLRDNDTTSWSDLWKYDPTTNLWTWVNGWGVPNDTGNTGIIGVPDTANRPGYIIGVTWLGLNDDLWLLQMNGRLWKYEINSNTWIWMNGDSFLPVYGNKGISSSSNTPGFRQWASTWTDSQGNLWLFGGNNSNLNYYNDVWKYDISINEWVWIGGTNILNDTGYYGILGVPNSMNLPHSRSGQASWIDTIGNLWIFGGHTTIIGNCFNYLNDLWMYETSTNQWTWISGPDTINSSGNYGSICIPSINHIPTARSYAVSWVDSINNLWLYGGFRRQPLCYGMWRSNDLWKLNLNTLEWSLMNGSNIYNQLAYIDNVGLASSLNQPGVINGTFGWVYNNEFYFQNRGHSSNLGLVNVLWKYSINPNGCQTSTEIKQEIDQLNYYNFFLFPNPTSSELNIQFTLTENKNVKLQLFNSLGQVVATIAEEKLNAGENKINLSIDHLPAGVYYLQLKVDDNMATKKVVKF